MQNLLVEVDLVRVRLLLHPLRSSRRAACSGSALLGAGAGRVHRRRDADLLRLEGRLVRLQNNLRILVRVRRVDHEVVVVAARHHILRIAREDHLELVEYAVVLVCVAESRPQVLVDRNSLHGLAFHSHIPNLHGEVVAGENVAPVVGEAHVGYRGDDFGEEGAG